MLNNAITLAVDVAGNNTIVNQVISRHEESANRTRYIFDSHSLTGRDVVDFYRTQPTKSGNFRGVAKSAAKITTDISVAGVDASTTLVSPLIGEISFSLPIGFTAAQVMLLRQRMIAILDNQLVVALNERLEI